MYLFIYKSKENYFFLFILVLKDDFRAEVYLFGPHSKESSWLL